MKFFTISLFMLLNVKAFGCVGNMCDQPPLPPVQFPVWTFNYQTADSLFKTLPVTSHLELYGFWIQIGGAEIYDIPNRLPKEGVGFNTDYLKYLYGRATHLNFTRTYDPADAKKVFATNIEFTANGNHQGPFRVNSDVNGQACFSTITGDRISWYNWECRIWDAQQETLLCGISATGASVNQIYFALRKRMNYSNVEIIGNKILLTTSKPIQDKNQVRIRAERPKGWSTITYIDRDRIPASEFTLLWTDGNEFRYELDLDKTGDLAQRGISHIHKTKIKLWITMYDNPALYTTRYDPTITVEAK